MLRWHLVNMYTVSSPSIIIRHISDYDVAKALAETHGGTAMLDNVYEGGAPPWVASALDWLDGGEGFPLRKEDDQRAMRWYEEMKKPGSTVVMPGDPRHPD